MTIYKWEFSKVAIKLLTWAVLSIIFLLIQTAKLSSFMTILEDCQLWHFGRFSEAFCPETALVDFQHNFLKLLTL